MMGDFHRADESDRSLIMPVRQGVIDRQISGLRSRLDDAWQRHIGFPGTADVDHTALADLLTRYALNNIGDPFSPGAVPNHTRAFEVQVLDLAAELFRAPDGGWWGCVTSGSSEGTLLGLRNARRIFPEAVVVHSACAHYSVTKAADLLAMPTAKVPATRRGEMDYHALSGVLSQHRHRRPVIVATIGTTMTEAIDDLRRITAVCDRLGIGASDRYIHADAALSGIPLAVAPLPGNPGFDLADGADSITTSGHKFLSTLMPSGIYLSRNPHDGHGPHVDYLASHDTTISGSRSGHLPLLLWHALARHGVDGLRRRAESARARAAYAHSRLLEIGWPSWRHEHAFTVVLRRPPHELAERWALPSSDDWSHLICMPGVSTSQVDAFIESLRLSRAMPATAGVQ